MDCFLAVLGQRLPLLWGAFQHLKLSVWPDPIVILIMLAVVWHLEERRGNYRSILTAWAIWPGVPRGGRTVFVALAQRNTPACDRFGL